MPDFAAFITKEQARIACAEILGWSPSKACGENVWHLKGRGFGLLRDNPDAKDVPDYPNSLDAMHEAEKTLNDAQRIEYVANLWRTNPIHKIEGYNWNQRALSNEIWWTLAHATAMQRLEAFLRVHGRNVEIDK